jgi:hypothetical protein
MQMQVREKYVDYKEINKKWGRLVTMLSLMAYGKTENIKRFVQMKTLTSVIKTIIINQNHIYRLLRPLQKRARIWKLKKMDFGYCLEGIN